MSEQTADNVLVPEELGQSRTGAAAAILQGDRMFNAGLAAAALLHVMLVILMTGFNSTSGTHRRIGDASGAEEAVSIALVTEADLRSRSTVPDKAAGLPVPPQPNQPQATPTPPPPPPPPEPEPPEPQAQPAEPPPPPEPVASPLSLPEPGLEPPAKTHEKKQTPDKSQAKPAEQTKPVEAQPRQSKSAPQRSAKLDLSPPPAVFSAPFGGAGAGVERPPGHTRSGENDDFARGVIRALQRTMPQLSNTFGRVTVRITLDKNGSIVSTEVVRPSNIAGLDQNVVFATRQSSFPLPPRNAVPADLIFVVTYIYR